MQRIALSILAVLALFLTYQTASAQVAEINGGILNGKAKKLPNPEYPDELRLSGIKGTVKIAVTIDHEGNVVFAEPVYQEDAIKGTDGESIPTPPGEHPHPLLVDEAQKAALAAKFSPTKLNGVPVRVKGLLIYIFGSEGIEKVPEPMEPRTFTAVRTKGVPSQISGGVLNGKAICLPRPDYPPAARAVRAGGIVTVQVLIDENGDIISASAVSGHPLLRAAAVDAARDAKFSPTMLSGELVKVSGVITYNFVPPKEVRDQ